MDASAGPVVLCADIGKTSCRVALVGSGEVLASAEQEGARAFRDLAASAAGAVSATTRRMPPHHVAAVSAVSVGVAGILNDPAEGKSLARSLHGTFNGPVAVTSDIVTAHLGAFSGGPGVALVAGTGAVALGLDAHGETRLIDGWGPDIGDLGSGAWIGREGFQAGLSGRCGRGPKTSLTSAVDRLTHGAEPASWVSGAGNSARQLARLAPSVLDEAESGDPVAAAIALRAIDMLSATAQAAGGPAVAVLGGLGQHPWFRTRLDVALSDHGLTVIVPAGDAIWGAYLAASRMDFPHERHIHRA